MIRVHRTLSFALLVLVFLIGCQPDLLDIGEYESRPSSKIRMHLSVSSEMELKNALSGFATENGYDFVVRRVHPTEPKLMVTMWRPDSLILLNNPFELTEYKVRIYSAVKDPPTVETAKDMLDQIKSAVLAKMKPDQAQQRMKHE